MARKGTLPELGHATRVAQLIASYDKRRERLMAGFLDGKITLAAFMPYLRKHAGEVLDDNAGAERLKMYERLELAEFVAEFGRAKWVDDEPNTIRVSSYVGWSVWEEVGRAAELEGMLPAEFVRLAIGEKCARVFEKNRTEEAGT